MPPRIVLPESLVIDRWVNDITTTTRSLGAEYGCSNTTIGLVLLRHLSAERIAEIRNSKIARSAALRPDLKTESHRIRARAASACSDPAKRRVSILKAVIVSAANRKGVPLSEACRRKLSVSHMGIQAGSNHPLWRGGTAKLCQRGIGWNAARRAARKRDRNTCRSCGKTAQQQGRNMDVHHRISYFSFAIPKRANRLNNLVCLCRSCHRRVENGKLLCP